jgi:hypothetical protein
MLQECGVVGDWHKYPTWAWHTVGAEIRALLLIHYVLQGSQSQRPETEADKRGNFYLRTHTPNHLLYLTDT